MSETTISPLSFHPSTVELEGVHLIEASAGTGKTYSIGLLVLRLILERNLPIERILITTFNERAGKEIKERIGRFLYEAQRYLDNPNLDSSLAEILQKENPAAGWEEKKNRIRRALLNLDKASISTIHSFCNKILNQYAFETHQLYGKTLIPELKPLITACVKEYLRTYLSPTKLPYLLPDFVTEVRLVEFIKQVVEGRQFAAFQEGFSMDEIRKKAEMAYNRLKKEGEGIIESKFRNGSKNKQKAKLKFKAPSLFIPFLRSTNNVGAITAFSEILDLDTLRDQVASHAIEHLVPSIFNVIEEQHLYTYQQLIDAVHQVREREDLAKAVRSDYDAVFIDEFQDTDGKQYQIFRDIFQKDPSKTVFYIGDPKQIIYAWRSADLHTYLDARKRTDLEGNLHTMTTNYRSSGQYLAAVNRYYSVLKEASDEKGTFFIKDIQYIPVSASMQREKAVGIVDKESKQMPCLLFQDTAEEKKALLNTVKALLGGAYQLNGRAISPSDIGILTRTNPDCKKIKEQLLAANIPAQLEGEYYLLETSEASLLQEIIDALLYPSEKNIHKMVLHPLVGTTVYELEYLDLPQFALELKQTKLQWEKQGPYPALISFYNYLGLKMEPTETNISLQRTVANLHHLAEVIQETTIQQGCTMETIQTLLKTKNSELSKLHQLRLESDENAVKIVTVHKSKGLEYPIVLVDQIDNIVDLKTNTITFTDEDKKSVVDFNKEVLKLDRLQANQTRVKDQQNQETARLVYVALTRAQYATYVFYKGVNKTPRLIEQYQRKVKPHDGSFFEKNPFLDQEDNQERSTAPEHSAPLKNPVLPYPALNLAERRFQVLSFSFLSRKRNLSIKRPQHQYEEQAYDAFAFHQLRKGPKTGDLLHQVFEFIDFQQPSDWAEKIRLAVLRHEPAQKDNDTYHQNIHQLIEHSLSAHIRIQGERIQLAELSRQQRIQELAFDFPVPSPLVTSALEQLFEPGDPRQIRTFHGQHKGMMHGVIDLFFEYNHKYYLLDWKSNFLGDHLDDYGPSSLLNAMNEHNYHLQYLLYTLAADRYLQSKLGSRYQYRTHFGGIIYLFLRGVRAGKESGVYTTRLPQDLLDRANALLGKLEFG